MVGRRPWVEKGGSALSVGLGRRVECVASALESQELKLLVPTLSGRRATAPSLGSPLLVCLWVLVPLGWG